ncbi:MAG: DNA polymerase I [Phycisphaerales bacterium]|nr:DNA polymerase I [Phycisphaerales bacterium]
MPTLYLIDAYAQFFRHYHAIRTPMSSPVTKEPTNMTFGFVGLLLRLLGAGGDADNALWTKLGGKPDYLAIAMDVSGDHGTFRSQLYPDYKATRTAPPEDLSPQVDRAIALLTALGIPIIGVEGVEADDIIATLVTTLRKSNPELAIRMVSKDKDLKQLLEDIHEGQDPPATPGVALVDVHTGLLIDAPALKTETGIAPSQVIDMLTLMGDTVDNVPGVSGVGEKTAAKLIAEYKTLDNLLASTDKLKGKQAENVKAAAAHLPLSKQLITLKRDVPIEFDLATSAIDTFTLDRLLPILKELGFNRYQDDLRNLMAKRGLAPPPSTTTPEPARPATPAPRPSKPDPSSFGSLFDTTPDNSPSPPPTFELQSHPGAAGALSTPPIQGNYTCITTIDQLDTLLARLHKAPSFALDTETTSLSPHDADICGISLAIQPGEAFYIPTLSPAPESHLTPDHVLSALKPILEDPTKTQSGHNLKYDQLVLRRAGIHLALSPLDDSMPGCLDASLPITHSSSPRSSALSAPSVSSSPSPSIDSMIASYLIDSSRSSHSLDALAQVYLGRGKQSINELIGSGKLQRSFAAVPIDQATTYAAADADIALQLAHAMLPQLRAMQLLPLFTDVEMPLIDVLAELEWNGILVEPDELDRQRERLNTRLNQIVIDLNTKATDTLGRTFDPDSPKQLSAALFNKPTDPIPGLGIKPIKKTKTGYSTDAEVLEKLADDETLTTPIPKLILEYRQLSKLVSTYLVALKEAIHPRTHRIHSSFNQTVAATGRLASSDPNLQNIPIRTEIGRDIRKAFIAAPGCSLITADYSQIELRLLAHLSHDPALVSAFHSGADIHTEVAAQIHQVPPDKVTKDQRSGAKMVNFGIVYGITSYGLARRLNIDDKKAAEIIAGYKRRFAGITTFLEECIAQAQRHGYVETMLKRRRIITDIDSTNPSRRALAERTAINSVVQGSAADLIKLALVDLYQLFKKPATFPATTTPTVGDADSNQVRMLLQIHDELVFESPDHLAKQARDIIVDRMQQAMTLSVPLLADAHIAKNWHEGK